MERKEKKEESRNVGDAKRHKEKTGGASLKRGNAM